MSRWYEDPLIVAGLLGAGGVATWALAQPEPLAFTVTDVFVRGHKLTTSLLLQSGVIREDPLSLFALAQVGWTGEPFDQATYSMARMVRSEGAAQGIVRCHVALNDLQSLGWTSLHYLLTYSTKSWAKGKYGKQYSAKYRALDGSETWDANVAARDSNGARIVIESQSRRYSTSKDPYAGDLMTALKARADHLNGFDPTGGAIKFLDRSSMGVQVGSNSFASVDARWRADGLVSYTIPEYGDDLVLYKKG